MSKKHELWIARNTETFGGNLTMFSKKPHCVIGKEVGAWYASGGNAYPLYKGMFTHLTFENSPKRIELKILEDE